MSNKDQDDGDFSNGSNSSKSKIHENDVDDENAFPAFEDDDFNDERPLLVRDDDDDDNGDEHDEQENHHHQTMMMMTQFKIPSAPPASEEEATDTIMSTNSSSVASSSVMSSSDVGSLFSCDSSSLPPPPAPTTSNSTEDVHHAAATTTTPSVISDATTTLHSNVAKNNNKHNMLTSEEDVQTMIAKIISEDLQQRRNPKKLKRYLRVLADLCRDTGFTKTSDEEYRQTQNAKYIVQLGGHGVIMGIIKKFGNNQPQLLAVALEAVMNLSYRQHANVADPLLAMGIVDNIVTALTRYPQLQELQESGCGALSNLALVASTGSHLKQKYFAERFIVLHGGTTATTTMDHRQDNSHYENTTTTTGLAVIVKASKMFPNKKLLQACAVDLVLHLSEEFPRLRDHMVQAGALVVLGTAMSIHEKDSDVYQDAKKAMLHLIN